MKQQMIDYFILNQKEDSCNSLACALTVVLFVLGMWALISLWPIAKPLLALTNSFISISVVFFTPFILMFACGYSIDPISKILMKINLFSGKNKTSDKLLEAPDLQENTKITYINGFKFDELADIHTIKKYNDGYVLIEKADKTLEQRSIYFFLDNYKW